jgi:hypothetical protein
LVVTGVDCDSIDPGPDRGPSFELPRLAEHREEGVLGGVERPLTITEDPQAHRKDPVLVVPHHLLERLTISTHDTSQQLAFVYRDRHGVNRTSASSA